MGHQVTTENHRASMSVMVDKILLKLTPILGWGSLILFVVCLSGGSLNIVKLDLTAGNATALNVILSLAFFIQHSGMIRKSFRNRTARFIDEKYNGVLFSIVSSLTLIAFAVLWQDSGILAASVEGPARLLLRAALIVSLFGFYWGVRSLGAFDAFGIGSLRRSLSGKTGKPARFRVVGPYRWVRHPLYFFILVMIWSCPDLTVDRLIFNALWTAWIVVGAMLEERDLVELFGEEYRHYQLQVPMLIPSTVRPYDRI